MAEMIDFTGANTHAGPPPGKEDEIGWLHCFRNGQAVVSAWKLTEREKAEGVVYVSVLSGPNVWPIFVGDESTCASVVADTGKVWR